MFLVPGFWFLVSSFKVRVNDVNGGHWWSMMINQSRFLVSSSLFLVSGSEVRVISVISVNGDQWCQSKSVSCSPQATHHHIFYLLSIIYYLLSALPSSASVCAAAARCRVIGISGFGISPQLQASNYYLLSFICYLLSVPLAVLISIICYPLSTIYYLLLRSCSHERSSSASADTTLSEFFCP